MADLDRVIEVGIRGPGTREDGTPIPGPITYQDVWARKRQDRTASLAVTQFGGELVSTPVFRIRYRQDFVDAFQAQNLYVRLSGTRHEVRVMTEVDRRRFLDIHLTGVI